MLTSLCINNPVHINAYLMHSELETSDFEWIKNQLSEYDISILPLKIDNNKFSSKVPVTVEWSLETYYRLLLFDILPNEIDRILYLDVDMIINKDISSLYSLSFENKEMIVCKNSNGFSKIKTDDGYIIQKAKFDSKNLSMDNYFNAGLLLINVTKCRNEHISFSTYLNAMDFWEYQMPEQDQDILNFVHGGKVKFVDWEKYDFFACLNIYNKFSYEEVKNNTYIIHFAGEKPWNSGDHKHYDLELIWWKYAEKTPFFNTLLKNFFIMDTEKSPYYENLITFENNILNAKKDLSNNINLITKIYNLLFPEKDIKDEKIPYINNDKIIEYKNSSYSFETWPFMKNHRALMEGLSDNEKLKTVILCNDLDSYITNLKDEYNTLNQYIQDSSELAKGLYKILIAKGTTV